MTRARLLAAIALVAGLIAVLAALGAAGGDGDVYRVRAVFDNASFVIAGEDVKVAGVKVGAIDALDLTRDNKAVVVLRIDDPAFRPFRADAHCRIALQSLIGEQFVECEPTQHHADGQKLPPPLPAIATGAGKGQHLLPVTNTTTPVGVDLLNDIMRVPERERFRLIVNELGAGLAGNGQELRAALRRANPALQQADRVVKVLADEDQLLGRLVDESDRVLAPLARHREDLGGFIQHAGRTAVATAQRGDALEQDVAKLPGFLRQLGPAAARFGALADEMTPAVRSLADQAPAVNASVQRLGPFTKAATPALTSLGAVAQRGRQTFPKIASLADDLGALARRLRPLAGNLGKLAGSFDSAGGIEAVMRFIYYYTGTVNGEDRLGHYIRSGLEVSVCSARKSQPAGGCEATFDKTKTKTKTKTATAQSAIATAPSSATSRALDYLLGPDGGRR